MQAWTDGGLSALVEKVEHERIQSEMLAFESPGLIGPCCLYGMHTAAPGEKADR